MEGPEAVLGLRRWGGAAGGGPRGGAGEVLGADLRGAGAASLPEGGLGALPAGARVGRCLLQVEEAVDVGRPAAGRFGPAPAGGRRCLKMLLCDGEAECVALEAEPCAAIPAAAPPGAKILVDGAEVRQGALLLKPGTFVWLWGQGPAFVSCANQAAGAWKAAATWKNFQPRAAAPTLQELGQLAREAFEAAAAGLPGLLPTAAGGVQGRAGEGAVDRRGGADVGLGRDGEATEPIDLDEGLHTAGAPDAPRGSPPGEVPPLSPPLQRSSQRLRRLKRGRESEQGPDDVMVPESPEAAGDPIVPASLPMPRPAHASRGLSGWEVPVASTFLADELRAAATPGRSFCVRASVASVCRVYSVDDGSPPRARETWDVALAIEDGTASAVVELGSKLAEEVMGMSPDTHSRLGENEQLAHLARINQRLTSWVGHAELAVQDSGSGAGLSRPRLLMSLMAPPVRPFSRTTPAAA